MSTRKSHAPHFLGIGAQRSATTWLHAQLDRHPEIWMPPIKELHYFDRLDSKHDGDRRYDKLLPPLIKRLKKKPGEFKLWYLRYFTGKQTDAWYRSLFTGAASRGLITGEITPAYATLPTDRIAQIVALNPDLRVIFLMRNPVDRFWSAVVNGLSKKLGKRPTELTEEDVAAVSTIESVQNLNVVEKKMTKSTYTANLQAWGGHLPPERFFKGFYDEVIEDPIAIFTRIQEFLGVKNTIEPEIDLRAKAPSKFKIPSDLERHLYGVFRPEIEALAQIWPDYPPRWLEKCDRILNSEK